VQTTIGFAITAIPIIIFPYFVDLVSWSYGFTFLALGPIIGLISLFSIKEKT
jgi:dipeptide/tripeptide permease